jgi:hypothetical protein
MRRLQQQYGLLKHALIWTDQADICKRKCHRFRVPEQTDRPEAEHAWNAACPNRQAAFLCAAICRAQKGGTGKWRFLSLTLQRPV